MRVSVCRMSLRGCSPYMFCRTRTTSEMCMSPINFLLFFVQRSSALLNIGFWLLCLFNLGPWKRNHRITVMILGHQMLVAATGSRSFLHLHRHLRFLEWCQDVRREVSIRD